MVSIDGIVLFKAGWELIKLLLVLNLDKIIEVYIYLQK